MPRKIVALTFLFISLILILGSSILGYSIYQNLRTQVYAQEFSNQTVQAEGISQSLYFQVILKKQMLRDMARIPEIRNFAATMPDSRNEADFLKNPYYLKVQNLFQEYLNEDGVDFIFMGSIHSSGWVGPEWENISSDYEARTRNWFVQPRERLGFYVSPLYAPTNAPETRVITLNVPIMVDDVFTGSLGLDMSMTTIFQELDEMGRQTGNRYSLHSINPRRSDGEYYSIFHPDFSLLEDVTVSQVYLSQGLVSENLEGFMDFMLDPNWGSLEYGASQTGRRRIIKQGIPETDWILVVDYGIDTIERYLFDQLLFISAALVVISASILGILFSFMKLRSKNLVLRQTLKELVRTQNQLVESSKQIALGYVIMGLAHEINTPLGNAMVLASIITDYAENQVSKQIHPKSEEFVDYIHLLQDSLQKIVTMVDRFKQLDVITKKKEAGTQKLIVIIEQEFQLAQLQSRDSGTRVTLGVSIVPDMPEVVQEFSMVFKELFENTFIHSVGKPSPDPTAKPQGVEIIIESWISDDNYNLFYRDTGIPIDNRLFGNLFEPFVTSDRKSGRIGLGLFLVSGIIHNLLSGSVELTTNSEGFLGFLITWPKIGKN